MHKKSPSCIVKQPFFCTFAMYKRMKCGSSSVGRASASQAESRGFESRLPLNILIIPYFPYIISYFIQPLYVLHTVGTCL